MCTLGLPCVLCSFHTVESCIGYQPDSNRKVSPKKRCANFGHEQSPSVPGEYNKSNRLVRMYVTRFLPDLRPLSCNSEILI